MKKYNVTVNGNLYQVEVEEVKGEFDAQVTTASPVTPVATTPVASTAAGVKAEAPMPGTIVKVVATKGATVKQGDILFVLEAMKMENEIMSPADGTVVDINVTQGAAVNTGDILAVIA